MSGSRFSDRRPMTVETTTRAPRLPRLWGRVGEPDGLEWCALRTALGVVVPAGDPLSATAGAESLRTTAEGNGVTVALASSEQEAIKIEGNRTG